MAITDVPAFAHLTDADIENLAFELDAIRQDIEDSRGERDARYIRRTIAAQRALEVAGRLMLAASSKRSAWWAGTVTLGVAKIIENMEIGHNVMHGQWDWMNDPEIHSSTWEWDMSGASKHWRFTHNFMHHKYTNILGMDDDVGYGMLRVTRDQQWKPFNLGNLLYNTMLASLLRVGRRPAAPGTRQDLQGPRRPRGDAGAGTRVRREGRPPGGQGLRGLPGADVAVAGRDLQVDAEGQRRGQHDPQRVVQRGDLLRSLPRRRREIHQDRHGRRDQGPVVPAADAGQRQLRERPGAAIHERQPLLPDRASPVPGPAEQPAARDLGAGAGRSATSTTCPTRRARSWCSTARRGGPSPSCRCRTSSCATPPTMRRRLAASGCSPSWSRSSGVG